MLLYYIKEAIAYSYFTKIKLKQLYRQFRHLFVYRLAKVLKRAKYNNINICTIKHLIKFYKQCQLYAKLLSRFKFTIKDNCNFNYLVIIDVLYLDKRLVI